MAPQLDHVKWLHSKVTAIGRCLLQEVLLQRHIPHLTAFVRESLDSLCRDGTNVQYMQYLSKSCLLITKSLKEEARVLK